MKPKSILKQRIHELNNKWQVLLLQIHTAEPTPELVAQHGVLGKLETLHNEVSTLVETLDKIQVPRATTACQHKKSVA